MVHTNKCTKRQIEQDQLKNNYCDERYGEEDVHYALSRKELLHNLLMVYQASFTDGKYTASIKALQLYGKEIGLFEKRKAYPLRADDLTYPEIQEMMKNLSDMHLEDNAELEIKSTKDFMNQEN